ncbi:hypothetical protein AK825_13315 [Psychrobacter sp. P11G5]|nr:hypothetical protein AK825_13315 [Psychrobacter sp. P11G5]
MLGNMAELMQYHIVDALLLGAFSKCRLSIKLLLIEQLPHYFFITIDLNIELFVVRDIAQKFDYSRHL